MNLSDSKLIFQVINNNLIIISESDKIKLKIKQKTNKKYKIIKLKNNTRSEFGLKHFLNFAKFKELTDIFKLELKNNYPARISFKLKKESKLEIYIAPSI